VVQCDASDSSVGSTEKHQCDSANNQRLDEYLPDDAVGSCSAGGGIDVCNACLPSVSK